MARIERYFGIDVRDFIERATWTLAPLVAGWLVAHFPGLVEFAGGEEATVTGVAALVFWILTYVWRTVSSRLPNPGDGLTRALPTARARGAGWRNADGPDVLPAPPRPLPPPGGRAGRGRRRGGAR